jgi:hypothetical protein
VRAVGRIGQVAQGERDGDGVGIERGHGEVLEGAAERGWHPRSLRREDFRQALRCPRGRTAAGGGEIVARAP